MKNINKFDYLSIYEIDKYHQEKREYINKLKKENKFYFEMSYDDLKYWYENLNYKLMELMIDNQKYEDNYFQIYGNDFKNLKIVYDPDRDINNSEYY